MKHISILVLFYSFTGNTAKLAKAIAAGASAVPGVTVTIKQIPEYLPVEFFADKPDLKKAREALDAEFPIATVDDLVDADGIALGTPTHFGSFAAQVKIFIDQLSPMWLKNKLVNKPAALFCTAGSTHGGEETALLSLIIPLMNLGMIPVGIPYPIQSMGPDFDAGSPYGAIFVTGHAPKPLPDADAKVAAILGQRLAELTAKLTA